MPTATPPMQPLSAQPLAVWNPIRGCWETSQPALLRAIGAILGDQANIGYETEWIGLPASLVGAPHHRFRIFITIHCQNAALNPARLGLIPRRREPGYRESQTGTAALSHQIIDFALHGPHGSPARQNACETLVYPDRDHLREWGGYADAIARWEHITGRPAPTPAFLTDDSTPRPAPDFVEWFMGLPSGWVTSPEHGLTANQQITALGNGVLPLQAVLAILSDR